MVKSKTKKPVRTRPLFGVNGPFNAAVISIDLVGSTKLKTDFPQVEQWTSCFNEFYTEVSDLIDRCGGATIKFVGDEVLAIVKEEGGSLVENCNQLIASIPKLHTALSKQFAVHLGQAYKAKVKTAIDYGNVYEITGASAPFNGHSDYLGIPVDRCARIGKLAREYAVLMSGDFVERCKNLDAQLPWNVVQLGCRAFRGLREPTTVYQVMPLDSQRLIALDDRTIQGSEEREYGDYEWMRKVICEFQGKIIQYQLSASKHSKQMKATFANRDQASVEEIQRARKHLEDELQIGHAALLNRFYEYLKRYFGNRKKHQPIITVESFTGTNQENVQILFRNGKKTDEEKPFKAEDISGYMHILADRKGFFLENNIPKAVQEGYKNRRLKDAEAQSYLDVHPDSLFNDDGEPDGNWKGCWTGPSSSEVMDEISTYYKSVLMVPVTIRGCAIDDEVWKLAPHIDKDRVYGVLSVEHHDPFYFHEKDIEICYIFADLYCLYRIIEHNYTQGDTEYKAVSELVGRA